MLYEFFLRPFLFRMDPERIHEVTLSILADTPASTLLRMATPFVAKPVELWGLTFRNPVGLAAGFDKNSVALHAWNALGFGFVEVGTVTRLPQPGNPRPRVFRCPRENALINRLGFPNDGAEVIALRLAKYRDKHRPADFPIGVNIGRSKSTPLAEAEEDYLHTFKCLYDHGDFFVVNVSSPNTPGLRDLQRPEALRPILRSLKRHDEEVAGHKPLLLKIAPDLSEEEILEILAVTDELAVDGIVATNTTTDHRGVRRQEQGGLSGAPLKSRSTEVIRFISKETAGRLPIIGVGGVFTRDDYLEKIDAGASLVELYTGFVYEGPSVVAKTLKG